MSDQLLSTMISRDGNLLVYRGVCAPAHRIAKDPFGGKTAQIQISHIFVGGAGGSGCCVRHLVTVWFELKKIFRPASSDCVHHR